MLKKRLFGSVISEKMSLSTKLVTWVVAFLAIFFCLLNVSGHTLKHVVEHPKSIIHPTKKIEIT